MTQHIPELSVDVLRIGDARFFSEPDTQGEPHGRLVLEGGVKGMEVHLRPNPHWEGPGIACQIIGYAHALVGGVRQGFARFAVTIRREALPGSDVVDIDSTVSGTRQAMPVRTRLGGRTNEADGSDDGGKMWTELYGNGDGELHLPDGRLVNIQQFVIGVLDRNPALAKKCTRKR